MIARQIEVNNKDPRFGGRSKDLHYDRHAAGVVQLFRAAVDQLLFNCLVLTSNFGVWYTYSRMKSLPHIFIGLLLGIAAPVGLASSSAPLAARAQDPPKERSTWDGIYTVAQAGRGEELYIKNCANCHGEGLAGDESIGAANLIGDFKKSWDARPLLRLFDKVNTRMPADKPGTLTRQETADIVSYLLQKNNFPAGPQELVPDEALLTQITFESIRVKK